MTLAQTERLLKLLRSYGVKNFKSSDIEITMEALESPTSNDSVTPTPPQAVVPRGTGLGTSELGILQQAASKQATKQDNAGDIQVKVAQVPHKINEMISVLQMNPEQLLDMVFPEGATPNPHHQPGGN